MISTQFKILILLILIFSTAQPALADDLHPGLSVEQLITLKGQPYYQTEHFANRKGEQVWLYTKKKEEKTVNENQITDPQTKWWPTLYRKTTTRVCEIGDVFVEVSNNQIKNIIPADPKMAYGPCVITNLEEFIPVVNGKSATSPAHKIENTVLEKSTLKK